MDVNHSHRTHGPNAHERYREAMADLVRRTRGKVQDSREAFHDASERTEARRSEAQMHAHHAQRRAHLARVDAATPETRDRIEISDDLAALTSAPEAGGAADEIRPKVARLKHAYRLGQLHTPERMERAAENMLRGHRHAPDAPASSSLGGPGGPNDAGAANDDGGANDAGGANVVG